MTDFLYETISQLAAADEQLLLIVNGAHSPFFDGLMWTVSAKWTWIPLYALLAYFIIHRFSWRNGMLALLMIALAITATDQTCASLLRPAMERLRPSNSDNPVSVFIHIVNGYRGGRYGFPSCHAANSFALAVFIALSLRNRYVTASMLSWAALVSYSRLYLGVHYPGDVLVGMIVGGMYAVFFFRLGKIFVIPRVPIILASCR